MHRCPIPLVPQCWHTRMLFRTCHLPEGLPASKGVHVTSQGIPTAESAICCVKTISIPGPKEACISGGHLNCVAVCVEDRGQRSAAHVHSSADVEPLILHRHRRQLYSSPADKPYPQTGPLPAVLQRRQTSIFAHPHISLIITMSRLLICGKSPTWHGHIGMLTKNDMPWILHTALRHPLTADARIAGRSIHVPKSRSGSESTCSSEAVLHMHPPITFRSRQPIS